MKKKLFVLLLCISILATSVVISGTMNANADDLGNIGLLANWYQINGLSSGDLNWRIGGDGKYTPQTLFASREFERVATGATDQNGLCISSEELDKLAGEMGIPNINGDYRYFGIKYMGYITPEESGTYSFRALADNAFVVYIDGKMVLDFWSSGWRDDPNNPYMGHSKYLEAGQEYKVEAYFVEIDGGNTFQLEWSRDGGAYGRIPPSFFTKTSNREVTIQRSFCVGAAQAAGDLDFILWQSEQVSAEVVSLTFQSEAGESIVISGDQCIRGGNLIHGIQNGWKPQLSQGNWRVSLTLKNVNTIARDDSNNVRFGIRFNAPGLCGHGNANFDTGAVQEIYAGETISCDPANGSVHFSANSLTIKELREGTSSCTFEPIGQPLSSSKAQTGLKSNWYKITGFNSSSLGNKLAERRITPADLFQSSDFQSMEIGRVDQNGFYIDSDQFNQIAEEVGIAAENGDYKLFGVQYYGYFTPAVTGSYKFKMLADNAFTLRIGGVEAIRHWDRGWKDNPNDPVIGNTLYLEAGKQYTIEAYFVEDYGGNLVLLEWSNDNGLSYERIPPELFKQSSDADIVISKDFSVGHKQSQGKADFTLWHSMNIKADIVSLTFIPEYGESILIPGASLHTDPNGLLISGIKESDRPQFAPGNWTAQLTLRNIDTGSRPDSDKIRFGIRFYGPGLVSHGEANFDIGNVAEIYPGELASYHPSNGSIGFDHNTLTVKQFRAGSSENLIWYEDSALPQLGEVAEEVYSVDLTFQSQEIKTAMATLQGIINRKQPRMLVLNDAGEQNLTWPRELGISHTFKLDYMDMIYQFKNEIKGLVIYDEAIPDTVNVAGTIAGVEDAIPVSSRIAELLVKEPYCLPVLVDLRGMFQDKYQAYEYLYANYWSRCSRRLFVGMHPTGHNAHFRDMAAAVKAVVIWLEPNNTADKALLDKFYSNAVSGTSYHGGWWPEEGSGVGYGTTKGVPTIPSDFFENATIYAAQSREIYTPTVPAKPDLENKVYVMLSISDGDNIQYTQHVMKMRWDSSRRGVIPLGWTCTPALLDAAPGILDHYYRTATDKDVLICGPSGIGYTRLQMFNSDYDTNRFFQATNRYFEKTGFDIITVWNQFPTNNTSRFSNAVNGYFPSLLGLTTQDKQSKEARIRILNGKTPLIIFADDSGLMSYDQSTGNIKNKIGNAAKNHKGNAPAFYAAQVVAWDVGVDQLIQMVDELNAQYPGKIEFVRPDHFMMLLNEANGNAINVSLQKTVTASGYDSGYTPSKAVDGSIAPENGWRCSGSGDKWLQIDLGRTRTISRYTLQNAGTAYMSNSLNTRDFKLQVSTDGSNWKDADTVTGNTDKIVYRDIQSVTARYVRLYITNPGADGIARIQDVEIFGK